MQQDMHLTRIETPPMFSLHFMFFAPQTLFSGLAIIHLSLLTFFLTIHYLLAFLLSSCFYIPYKPFDFYFETS